MVVLQLPDTHSRAGVDADGAFCAVTVVDARSKAGARAERDRGSGGEGPREAGAGGGAAEMGDGRRGLAGCPAPVRGSE